MNYDFRAPAVAESPTGLAEYLFYVDGQRWSEVCPASLDCRDNRLMRVYPLGRPGQGRCRCGGVSNSCTHTAHAVIHGKRRTCHPGMPASGGQSLPQMTRQKCDTRGEGAEKISELRRVRAIAQSGSGVSKCGGTPQNKPSAPTLHSFKVPEHPCRSAESGMALTKTA